jgi:hypothetical protein
MNETRRKIGNIKKVCYKNKNSQNSEKQNYIIEGPEAVAQW